MISFLNEFSGCFSRGEYGMNDSDGDGNIHYDDESLVGIS